jgi:hypothetical protein
LNRKLWLLNFVLIAAISGGAWRLRKESQEFHLRERTTLSKKTAIPPTPPAPPAAPAPVVTATSYLDIAQKMLWSKDRNSQVVVDPPKPPEPPKPLPPLPAVHGVMNLGDGPIVMMSDKPGSRHRGIHPGDTIGEYKLVSVDSEGLVLAFESRLVKKKLQELIDRGQDTGPATGGQAQGSTANMGTVANAATPPPPPAKPEPGGKLTEGLSQCQPGDTSPPGTIANGMRKVVSQTPFGPACRWESVK